MATLTVRTETWSINGGFTIARGRTTEATVVVVELSDGPHRGRGECSPTARYGETPDSVVAQLQGLALDLADGLSREDLQTRLPPGAARNAADCAFWDLESARSGRSVAALAGLPEPGETITAYTVSLDTPTAMAAQAARAVAAGHPLLKLKLGGDGDLARLEAVRAAAPDTRLIVDANESWSLDQLTRDAPLYAQAGVELIEQPLPAGADDALTDLACPLPLCADESFHDLASLEAVAGRYQVVNIKLDKTGGLTEALRVYASAQAQGLDLFVGCMVATSLSMAPALVLAGAARWVDLDGALLLTRDRQPGLRYAAGRIAPPPPGLWGSAHAAGPALM